MNLCKNLIFCFIDSVSLKFQCYLTSEMETNCVCDNHITKFLKIHFETCSLLNRNTNSALAENFSGSFLRKSDEHNQNVHYKPFSQ